MYEIILNAWKNGSGFVYNEFFDSLEEFITAREYVKSLDDKINFVHCDDILVTVKKEDEILDEEWLSEIYKEVD